MTSGSQVSEKASDFDTPDKSRGRVPLPESSVAAGDGAPDASNGLTRYYAESGTPPGILLDAGLARLAGDDGVEKGSVVTEQRLPAIHERYIAPGLEPERVRRFGRRPAARDPIPAAPSLSSPQ